MKYSKYDYLGLVMTVLVIAFSKQILDLNIVLKSSIIIGFVVLGLYFNYKAYSTLSAADRKKRFLQTLIPFLLCCGIFLYYYVRFDK